VTSQKLALLLETLRIVTRRLRLSGWAIESHTRTETKSLEDVQRRVFTALHGMQTRSYDEISVRLSVCLSVRLSNACIVTKRKKDMFRFLYHTKEHLS